jgi:hypothetical protein
MSATPLLEAVLLAVTELREEVAALRADLRRQQAEPALLSVLEEEFGPGRFTAAGLLRLAAEEPHSPLAEALAALIDMNARPRSRATALGARLRRMAGIEIVARAHGCAVYRVASEPEPT